MPSAERQTRLAELVEVYAAMVRRSSVEVVQALLRTKAATKMGFSGGLLETDEQADACIRILESWIQRTETQQ